MTVDEAARWAELEIRKERIEKAIDELNAAFDAAGLPTKCYLTVGPQPVFMVDRVGPWQPRTSRRSR